MLCILLIHLAGNDMKPRMIKFDDPLIEQVQDFANRQFNGNFSEAVRYSCAKVTKNEKHTDITSNDNERLRRD
jgi:predicted DNA-binding ribbon-helix-helix protein